MAKTEPARECAYTMSGRHMYTPKTFGRGAEAKERIVCACGAVPPVLKEAKAELRAVSQYRQRLAHESARLIRKLHKQHVESGAQPKLPL